ncbi:hypothetical protein [Chryseobacterium sp.]|uniref:DUF7832 domain-containing protein n=1 Tax=Chryseobacterium sp. TaxID=1871047 RepID=UPI00289CB2B4|nr:hypothetical protein [Chryseobacterium sp.]
MTLYDNAAWHLGEDFPKDVPQNNAATHFGMFLNWCIENNLHSAELQNNFSQEIESLLKRDFTVAEFILTHLDGKLTSEELNDLGNAFAQDYFVDETKFTANFGSFADDYVNIFDAKAEESDFQYDTFYHIEDTFENYDLMKQAIDFRFQEWKEFLKE